MCSRELLGQPASPTERGRSPAVVLLTDDDAPARLANANTGARRISHVVISKRLVVTNAVSAVLVRLLNVFLLLWVYHYLLARISPEQFAVYPVVMAMMLFAPLFFSFFTGVSTSDQNQASGAE